MSRQGLDGLLLGARHPRLDARDPAGPDPGVSRRPGERREPLR